jgi:hypothetical protein
VNFLHFPTHHQLTQFWRSVHEISGPQLCRFIGSRLAR